MLVFSADFDEFKHEDSFSNWNSTTAAQLNPFQSLKGGIRWTSKCQRDNTGRLLSVLVWAACLNVIHKISQKDQQWKPEQFYHFAFGWRCISFKQHKTEGLFGLAAPSLAPLFTLLRAQTVHQLAESEALITMGSYKDPVICLKVMLKDSTHKH